MSAVDRTPISVVLMRLFACVALSGGVYNILAGALLGTCNGPSLAKEGCCEVVLAYIVFSLFPREYDPPVKPPAESPDATTCSN